MNNQTSWTNGILKWGVVVVVLGLVMAVVGLVAPGFITSLTLFGRLFTAIGLVLIVLGVVSLLQYGYIQLDPKAGKQMLIHEQDERMQWIRARAGQRAFWISGSLAFAVLMWASFAGNVGLPTLSGNTLWFSLLAVVIVPSIVYIIGIVYGLSNN